MPRLVDPTARRAELLAPAFALFADRGYAAVSMRDLARAAGVTTGALYHYFPSKEALFEALVRDRAAADVAGATRSLPASASPEERLAALTTYVVRNLDPLQDALRLVIDFVQQRPEPAARAFVAAVLDAYRAPLREVFGPELAPVGLSLFLGLLVQRLLDPGRVELRAHVAALQRLGPIEE